MSRSRRYLPRASLDGLAAFSRKGSEAFGVESSLDVFRSYLSWMDKHGEYFFRDPWPRKRDAKAAVEFTSDDLAFIDEVEVEVEE